MWTGSLFISIAAALLIDRVAGEPDAVWRRLPHPVVLVGRAIDLLERRLRRPADTPARERRMGTVLITLLTLAGLACGWFLQTALLALPLGWLWLGLIMSTLIAQKSLLDHVDAVAAGLQQSIEVGRLAVARIVGRDTATLDGPAIGRAATESLAENLSDGVIAPLFWALLLGLPGILAYKIVNTADSMIGHKTPRHLHFGRAAARLDDALNWLPARLTASLVIVAASCTGTAREAWRITRRDARLHRSPNAGWPEAAMAGALGVRLSGPRIYGGKPTIEPWVGDGSAEIGPAKLRQALRLADRVWLLVLVAVLGFCGLSLT
jgi:adenosylcobinamide-phosphate synthase